MSRSGRDDIPPLGPMDPSAPDYRPAIAVPGYSLPHDGLKLEKARFANPSPFFLLFMAAVILFSTFGLLFLYSDEFVLAGITIAGGAVIIYRLLVSALRAERDSTRSGVQFSVNWRSLAMALLLSTGALMANLLVPYEDLHFLAAYSVRGITAILLVIGLCWTFIALRD